MYTVKQVATLAGITVRTLHHYDALGLLKPSRTGDNGYRYYGEEALLLLQQILFYRELGMDLETIGKLMGRRGFTVVAALESHRKALGRRVERLQRLLVTVDKTIAQQKGETTMQQEEWFDGLSDQEKAYADEAAQKWDPEVVKESNRRYARLSAAEKKALQEEQQAVIRDWGNLLGERPDSPRVFAHVERWKKGLDFFYTTTAEGLIALAQLFNDDPRFKANYDRVDPRLAAFVLECVQAWAAK